MLKLRWTTPAADSLEAAHAFYYNINPRAARHLAKRILEATRLLRERPELGRPGLREGTREWVVGRSPYILVYRTTPEALEILHVWHGAQDWKKDT